MRRIGDRGFTPTPAMKLYAAAKATGGDGLSQTELASRCGVHYVTVSKWNALAGFDEWLTSAVARHRAPILELLRQIAIDNIDDFRFWEALSYKYGFLNRDDKPASVQQIMKPVDKETLLAVVRTIREGK